MTSRGSLAHTLPLAYGTTFGKAVPHWKIREITWSQFCLLLDKPATSKTGALSYIPGTITPGPGNKCKCDEYLHRTKDNVRDRWAITLDADYCGNAGSALVRNLHGIDSAAAIHTTWSSTEDDERYRIIIPLHRPVNALEYAPLARLLMSTLGEGMFDATCEQHSRLMYLPAAPNGGDNYWRAVMDGYPLDVDFWLELAGGPDVVTERQPVPVVPAEDDIGHLSAVHERQIKGLCVKLMDQKEGNRDNFLLWALKAVIDNGIDPDVAGRRLEQAGILAGLDPDVCREKVDRILGT